MSRIDTQFSAAPSTIGYLFQCRYALYESLRRLPSGEDFSISIETLDDVVFETEGTPPELLQLKHHVKESGNLTDASPDLWKTIRIWCEGLNKGDIPDGAVFFLISTSRVGSGSAAYYLRAGDTRDVSKALERLNATVGSSTSDTNARGYTAFRSLSSDQKTMLLESVYVLDSVPTITDLDAAFHQALFYAAELRFLDSLITRLEGWWLKRAILQLAGTKSGPILGEEISSEISRLREQFKDDNLPIDDDIFEATVDASGYQGEAFVHQLRLIGVGNKRIYHAIRNYFRAFEQRSRWVQEDLIYVGDLSRYEERLVEEWELRFEQMREELGVSAAEEKKKEAAQKLYQWIETGEHPMIRPHCAEPFVPRGTYQMLADNWKIGWHPEYVDRLKQLLESV